MSLVRVLERAMRLAKAATIVAAVGCGSQVVAVETSEAHTPPHASRSAAPSPAGSAHAATGALEPLEVAVTVDDLPVHGPSFVGIDRVAIVDRFVATFAAHHLPPVYGFVNQKKVDDAPETREILRHWIRAGNPLGNHTYSHISLNDASVDEYLADLEKGEGVLRELGGTEAKWRVFRYPFLFEGPDLDKRNRVRKYLFEHHYEIAEVTIDGDDWAWNAPFARCSDAHDEDALARLRESYVRTHVDELRFMRKVTRQIAGRDIRHVLLLHIGAADADALDALLSAFEAEGVRFIDLQTAIADPIYAEDPARASRAGAAFPYPLAKSKGISIGPLPERPQEEALDWMCR